MGLVSAWPIEMIRSDHYEGLECHWSQGWISPPRTDRYICGPNGRHIFIDPMMKKMFDPQVGQYLVQWPTGMITFRDEESFKRDFDHLRQDLYYTELQPLFSSPEVH